MLARRSIDARSKNIIARVRVDVYIDEPIPTPKPYCSYLTAVHEAPKTVAIIGAGPAGYFAALELIEKGIRPILFERGKDVRARRRDLRAIQQFGEVNPDSNYCFGEGGAGTYSDGKLYTRSKKRGKIEKVLQLLVEHGATTDILVDAHPHIGSNKLPKIIAAFRATIEAHGGQVHFDSRVTDFRVEKDTKGRKITGLEINQERTFDCDQVILATGHSARDIFDLLQKHNVEMEAKPFALGVRIEHPQALIDEMQYRQRERDEHLPAASYSLVCQSDNRGVFSFCMCPGGLIVPAATAPGELVVNGMSLSRRDSAYANSGMVVAVGEEDWQAFRDKGSLAGVAYQKMVEQRMFNAGDGSQKAPAQRMTDFVKKRVSKSLPDTSYLPGVYAAPMHDLLPEAVVKRLQDAFQVFGKKRKGYFTSEAQIVGTESRTSCPVRIPRRPETLEHPQIRGLFPCGEGAGYAGGIVSAAMDGQRVAKAIAVLLDA